MSTVCGCGVLRRLIKPSHCRFPPTQPPQKQQVGNCRSHVTAQCRELKTDAG